ncbi:snRNA-activating protein complex subunit 1b [Dunckerocampus dactyliophorus]|uniref:snRNA-activating protein complex subunit 1b n=1 Tax=Dunckerocampus dactyliophorus TaxID=161453 RepID=UPI002406E262|nr:snRNA-activating protein complex subunit 1b [Dunckerocampus dactyliophorus]
MNSCRKQVKCDCEELLHRFQQSESVRFEVFSKIWREMKFEQIFYGAVGREKRAFSRLVLDAAYIYFLPPFSFQIRVGGLYLLYSLFQCQTASPCVGIRIALKDWVDIQTFEKDALGAQHFDTVFIFHQLMFQKAFYFTAMPTLLTFNKNKVEEAKSQLYKKFVARACGPQELINNELLEELSNVHELYRKHKTSMYSEAQQADLGIDLIRKNLIPQLRGSVMTFHTWQKRKQQDESDEEEVATEGTSSQAECARRADLLSSIKSKAYGEAAEAFKSRRHRQVDVDTSIKAGPAPLKGHTRTSKPSLKARTNENIHISGDVWKEATTMTRINRLTALDHVPEEKNPQ